MTVNFEEIALVEVPWYSGGSADGYYAQPSMASERYHDEAHGAGRWHNVTTNNFWAVDLAGRNAITNTWYAGSLTWDIPLGWNAKDQRSGAPAVKTFETVQMKFNIDSNGTVRVEKFGHWTSRAMSTHPEGPDDGAVLLDGNLMDPRRDISTWLEKDKDLIWL